MMIIIIIIVITFDDNKNNEDDNNNNNNSSSNDDGNNQTCACRAGFLSSVAHHVMQHVLVHVPFTRHTAQDLMQRAARAWMNAKAWLVALSAMVLVSGSSNSF